MELCFKRVSKSVTYIISKYNVSNVLERAVKQVNLRKKYAEQYVGTYIRIPYHLQIKINTVIFKVKLQTPNSQESIT
jgi:hypothetical protein